MKLLNIRIARIEGTASGMPMAIIVNDDDRHEALGALIPFRGYAFQVDGNANPPNSGGDYGSTPVFGLNNILLGSLDGGEGFGCASNLSELQIKIEILKAMAYRAIDKFVEYLEVLRNLPNKDGTTNEEVVVRFRDSKPVSRELDDGGVLPTFSPTMMDVFIAYVVRWMDEETYKRYAFRHRQKVI